MCEYCKVTTVNYTIERDGRAFIISIDSNCTVSNFMFNHTSEKIDFNVSRQLGKAAFCNITLSTQLLGGPYRVLLDGSPIIPIEKSNSTHTYIYFTYSQSRRHIEVTGITPVSEFPAITAFLVFLTVLTLLFLFLKLSPEGN